MSEQQLEARGDRSDSSQALGATEFSPGKYVDLRAEVLSQPTPTMWAAMEDAEVGWYSLRQDENIELLECRVAALAGKEAAFFVITGAVANLLAVMSLSERGTQIVMERRCHIYWHEANGAAYMMGLATRLLDGGRFGKMDPTDLGIVLDEAYGFAQQTSLVCLENTHSIAGGCILTPEETTRLAQVARDHGAAAVYLDGARLWNAAAALGVPLANLLDGIDAAMVSMNKSLGAPVGAVLVGSSEFIKNARFHAKRLGVYSIHRMGYFAAAALVALETMMDRIPEDHIHARMLAEGLSAIDGLEVDLETVHTNVVRVKVVGEEKNAARFVEGLDRRGVGARVIEPPRIVKFNTHFGIGANDIDYAIAMASETMIDEQ